MSDPTQDGDRGRFWGRLRERKVVQWGIAYVAGSWGFLEGLSYAVATFHWSEHIQQSATVLLLLGLPIALALAWYHGDRGEQRVSGVEFAVVCLLLVLGGAVFWHYQHSSETPQAAVAASGPGITPAAERGVSIAVLPFVNMSSDKEQDYFSDGLSEEMLSLLAQVPQLRVIARTSSFSFKGRGADVATIAKVLGVTHVLEGSVRKSADRLRITVQLVRAADSTQLWSHTYDRQVSDVFQLQDEIAAAVVDQLRIKLLGDAPRARAVDPKAYALFLQARAVGRQNTADGYDRAIALYQRSLEIDPDYPAAWVGLAGTYCDQTYNFLLSSDEAMRLAHQATAKALALDPDFAPAHARLGWIAIYIERDFAAAAEHIGHALELAPADPETLSIAASLSTRLRRFDQSIALDEYVAERDPVNSAAHERLAYTYLYAGRFDDAIAEFRAELDLSPASIGVHSLIGETLLHKDEPEAALREMLLERDDGNRLVGLSMAYHALGREAESKEALAELTRRFEHSMPYFIAFAHAFRGEADSAFEWLERALAANDAAVGSIAAYPIFGRLESDPRWKPFLRKAGVDPESFAGIRFDPRPPG